MKVNIKVWHSDILKMSHGKANPFRCHRDTVMAIFKIMNVKTRSFTQASMKSQTHRSIGELEGVATENHEQMKSTTGRRGGKMHRRPVVGKDCIFKVSTFLEIPIFDKVCEMPVLLQLQQIPRATGRSHEELAGTRSPLARATKVTVSIGEARKQGGKRAGGGERGSGGEGESESERH
jgi:hypothetical protein